MQRLLTALKEATRDPRFWHFAVDTSSRQRHAVSGHHGDVHGHKWNDVITKWVEKGQKALLYCVITVQVLYNIKRLPHILKRLLEAQKPHHFDMYTNWFLEMRDVRYYNITSRVAFSIHAINMFASCRNPCYVFTWLFLHFYMVSNIGVTMRLPDALYFEGYIIIITLTSIWLCVTSLK